MNQKVATVLVIDDVPQVTELLARFLARADLYTVIAADGIIGLRQARKLLPDLILCDANLPGLDGLDLIKWLKNAPTTAHIPIVLMSGIRCDDSGADAFLQKPFLMTEMLALVRSLILSRQTNGAKDRREFL